LAGKGKCAAGGASNFLIGRLKEMDSSTVRLICLVLAIVIGGLIVMRRKKNAE